MSIVPRQLSKCLICSVVLRGAHVVAVAVHGGHLAENGERSVLGLSNVDSEWLTQQAGVTGWPMGSVDGGALSLPPSWSARVAQQLTQPAEQNSPHLSL